MGLALGGALLQLLQTLRDVEGEVDEDPVRLALDLVGAEEYVGLEVVKRLVDDVRLVGGGQAGGRPTGLSTRSFNFFFLLIFSFFSIFTFFLPLLFCTGTKSCSREGGDPCVVVVALINRLPKEKYPPNK